MKEKKLRRLVYWLLILLALSQIYVIRELVAILLFFAIAYVLVMPIIFMAVSIQTFWNKVVNKILDG